MAQAQSAADFETPEYLAQQGLAAINASTAYAAGFTGAGTLIAVIDDGFQVAHPELNGKVRHQLHTGWPVGAFDVPFGDHGTHVAGIAAGRRDGTGMHGVAFDADLALYTLGAGADPTVSGPMFPFEGATRAFREAAAQGAHVINNSWGLPFQVTFFQPGGGYAANPIGILGWLASDAVPDGPQLPEHERTARDFIAAMDAAQENSVIVFAVDNTAAFTDVDISAGLPLIAPELREAWIAVANMHVGPTVTFLNDDGDLETYESGTLISAPCGQAAQFCMVAPGTRIVSAVPVDGYTVYDGSSQAAPHVSGAVAIARQMFPNATPAELTQLVLQTATDIGAPGVDAQFGWGLLNLANLTAAATPATGQSAPVPLIAQVSTLGAFTSLMGAQTGPRSPAAAGSLTPVASSRSPSAADPWRSQMIAPRVWLLPMAQHLTVQGGPTWTGFDARTSGLAIGLDWTPDSLAQLWRIGIAAGVSGASSDAVNAASAGRTSGVHVGLYAGLQDGPLQVDASLQLARLDQDQSRFNVVGVGALAQTASASFASLAAEANLRVGYAYAHERLTLTPYVTAAARQVRQDGYTETGAGALNLTVAPNTITQGEIGLGVRAERQFDIGRAWSLSGSFDLSHSYMLGEHTPTSQISLLGSPLPGTGIDLGRHATTIGAELSLGRPSTDFTASLRYEGRLQQNALSHGVSALLSLTF
jgi:outer membrane autotransporter protein